MGKILAPVTIQNMQDPTQSLRVNAFVDTAAAYLTLPTSWKSRLGNLRRFRTVRIQLADQSHGSAEIYGPVSLRIDGFEEISTEVLFLDMDPDHDGTYEALLGYIPLEQANASVDMVGHRLVALKYVDVKRAA